MKNIWILLSLLSSILIHTIGIAATKDEVLGTLKVFCEQNQNDHWIKTSDACQLVAGKHDLKDLCEGTSKGQTKKEIRLRAIADKYASIKSIDVDFAQKQICSEFTGEHVIASNPMCGDDASVTRRWWTGSEWKTTTESLTAVKRRADQNDPIAQFNIGYWYASGAECVSRDLAKSVPFYCRAYDQGFQMASVQLQLLKKMPTADLSREALGKEYGCAPTTHQKEYEAETRKYELEAQANIKKAEAGDVRAMYKVGTLYLSDDYGLKLDYKAAVKWFEKAAAKGHAQSMGALAGMYNRGDGVPKDQRKAFEWASKAVAKGDTDSMLFLGDCYYHGQGTSENLVKAVQFYSKAMDRGNTDAKERLIEMYQRGELQAATFRVISERLKALQKQR